VGIGISEEPNVLAPGLRMLVACDRGDSIFDRPARSKLVLIESQSYRVLLPAAFYDPEFAPDSRAGLSARHRTDVWREALGLLAAESCYRCSDPDLRVVHQSWISKSALHDGAFQERAGRRLGGRARQMKREDDR